MPRALRYPGLAADTRQIVPTRGDQSAVWQVPDAKGGIDTFLGQVDLSIAERQADVDIRISPKKISQHRHQMQATENDGRRHAEFALGRSVLPAAMRSASPTSSRIRLQAAT